MKLSCFVILGLMYFLISGSSSNKPSKCDIRVWHMEIMELLFPKLAELTRTQMSALEKVEQLMEHVQDGEMLPVTSCAILNTYTTILLPIADGKKLMKEVILKTEEAMAEEAAAAEALSKQREKLLESDPEKMKAKAVDLDDARHPEESDTESRTIRDEEEDRGIGDEHERGGSDDTVNEGDETDQSDDDGEENDKDNETQVIEKNTPMQNRGHKDENDETGLDKDNEDDDTDKREDGGERENVKHSERGNKRDKEADDDDDEEEIHVLDAYGNFARENDADGQENDVMEEDKSSFNDDDKSKRGNEDEKDNIKENDGDEKNDDIGVMIFYDDDDDDDDDRGEGENDVGNAADDSKETQNSRDEDISIKSQKNVDESEDVEDIMPDDNGSRTTDVDDDDDDADDDPTDDANKAEDVDNDNNYKNDLDDRISPKDNDMGNNIFYYDDDDEDEDEDEDVDDNYGKHVEDDNFASKRDHDESQEATGRNTHVGFKLMGSLLSTLYTTHCVEHNLFDPSTTCDNTCAYFHILLMKCDLVDSQAHEKQSKKLSNMRTSSLPSDKVNRESSYEKTDSDENDDVEVSSKERAVKNENQKTNSKKASEESHKSERSEFNVKDIESMLNKRESDQATKIQQLELMIVKLENRILTHSMEKQDGSSAVIGLENQILKLENELLKLNQSYHQLKEDHETLNSRHSSFVETQTARPKYLALADNSSKELMTQQQGKLSELQKLLQNQSDVVQKLQSRSELLEDQNRKLFEVVMNQTALISHIMSQMQELSEDGLRSKIQAEEFKIKLEQLKQSQAFRERVLTDESQLDQTLTRRQSVDTYDYATDSSVKGKPSVAIKDFVTKIMLIVKKSPSVALPTLNRAETWRCNGLNSTKLCIFRTLVISNCTPFNDIHWGRCKPMFSSLILEKDVVNKLDGIDEIVMADSMVPGGGQSPEAFVNERSQTQRGAGVKGGPSDAKEVVSKPAENVEKEEIGSAMPKSGEMHAKGSGDNGTIKDSSQTQREVEEDELSSASPISSRTAPLRADKETKHTKQFGSVKDSENEEDQYEYDSSAGATNVQSREHSVYSGKVTTKSGDNSKGPIETGAEKRVISPEMNKARDLPSASHPAGDKPASKSDETTSNSDSSCLSEEGSSACKSTPSSQTPKPSADKKANYSSVDHSKDKLQQPNLGTKASKKEGTKAHNTELNAEPKIKNGDELDNRNTGNASQQPNGPDIPRNAARPVEDDAIVARSHSKDVKKEDKEQTSSIEKKDGADIPKATSQQEKFDETKGAEKIPKTEKEIKEMKEAAAEAKALHEALHRKILYESLHSNRPKDCYELYKFGQRRSGMSQIFVSGLDVYVSVYCDMKNGGWTVLLRREDGLVDFYRDYEQYKEGFGAPRGEHYIGNEVIHYMTNQGHYSLKAELGDWTGNTRHAHYDHFWIDGEDDGFQFHIHGYSGTAGDGLSKHNGMKFSTFDNDNDLLKTEMGGNCAKRFHAAGWFFKCYASNLMGKYYQGGNIPDKRFDGVAWKPWLGPGYSLKTAVLAIRPYGAEK